MSQFFIIKVNLYVHFISLKHMVGIALYGARLEFSSIICSFAKTQMPNFKPEDELICYSDVCTGQNRNAILSSVLLNFAVYHQVHIVQKYLERGHTQMKADSIYSCIERRLENKVINVPADYMDVVVLFKDCHCGNTVAMKFDGKKYRQKFT